MSDAVSGTDEQVVIKVDFTMYDLIVFTPDHPDGIHAFGDVDRDHPEALERAWDFVEDQLLPGRKDRIKWAAIKELARVFGRGS